MSDKLTVSLGKSEVTLEKSKLLVGLKTTTTDDPSFVDQKLMQNLGGFEVVTLHTEDKSLDDTLDEIRRDDRVEKGTHLYFPEGSEKPVIPTGDIIIQFHTGVSEGEQTTVLNAYHLELVDRKSETLLIAEVTDKSPNPIKTAALLATLAMVERAEPDVDTPLSEYSFTAPTDTLMSHMWHLKNTGVIPDVGYRTTPNADAKVVDAWRRLGNMGSSQVTIAVIDNGFDLTHPDLQGKVVRPFDLWSQSSNLLQNDARFTHGTPCASVALASANGDGMVGAAPNARFMPLSGTSFALRATEQMFDYCVRNDADIISCSWGTVDPNYALNSLKEAAISRAARQGRAGKGCVIVFAAGNEGASRVNYYGAHPDVIAVGACTSKNQYPSYSNRGIELSVCAPSHGDWPILAARAWWDPGLSNETGEYRYWRDGRSRGEKYKHFGGTSSATPLVAGICALMLSANPNLTAREVKDILQSTADKIGGSWEYDSRGHSVKYGYGCVNADRAVAEALRRKDKNNVVNKPTTLTTPTGGTPAPFNPGTTPIPTNNQGNGIYRFNVGPQAAKGWSVQIGSFSNYANVISQADSLQRKFNQPVLVHIQEQGGQTVYRVLVGSFPDVDDANLLKNRMAAVGIQGFVRNLKDLV